jgi:hypothetical protein
MLFDLKPKETPKDLFDRAEEQAELARLVDAGSWVIVLGKRMAGKTSLIKTFAKARGGVYLNLLAARGVEDLARNLMAESGVRLEQVGLDLTPLHIRWTRVAAQGLARVKDRVVVFDEIQEISSPYLLRLLKSAWDSYRKLRVVFSGSYIGILKGLVNPHPGSPLFGRSPATIVLKPFLPEASKEFLKVGFREHRRVAVGSDEVEEVVGKLNGYVGWLTYYGHLRCIRRLRHAEALQATITEGAKILQGEVNHFLTKRRRDLYLKVLRMTAVGARWSELRRELAVNSKTLRDVLKALTSVMMVEERDGFYWIEDPILREATKGLRL